MNNIVIEFLASFLIWIMFASLLVLWAINGRIKKEQVLHALAASLIAWTLAEVIKRLIPTARPFMVNGGTPLTFTVNQDGSFPSGHTAGAFALATTIWLHDRKLGWAYVISAVVVGSARVLANVHYPADILAGALLGIFTAMGVEKAHLFSLLSKLRAKFKRN